MGNGVKGSLVFAVATNHHTLEASHQPQQVLPISGSLHPSLFPVSHLTLPSIIGTEPTRLVSWEKVGSN